MGRAHALFSSLDCVQVVSSPTVSSALDTAPLAAGTPVTRVEQTNWRARDDEQRCTENSSRATVLDTEPIEVKRQDKLVCIEEHCLVSSLSESAAEIPCFDLAGGENLWAIEDDYAEVWKDIVQTWLPSEEETQFGSNIQGDDESEQRYSDVHRASTERPDRLFARALL